MKKGETFIPPFKLYIQPFGIPDIPKTDYIKFVTATFL